MLDRLLRVAELRLQGADRRVLAAQAALMAAEAAVVEARARQERLLDQVAEQRRLAREAFVSSVHARVLIEDMLMDLTSFDRAEAAAEEAVGAAIAKRDAARPPLTEARALRRQAQIKVEKRREMARQEEVKRRTAQAAVAEADALEQWVAGQRA